MAASSSSRRGGNEGGGDALGMALKGVRADAEAHRQARKSPQKIYSGVKSKVAGNIKSIKRAQTKSIVAKANSSAKVESFGAYGDVSPMK